MTTFRELLAQINAPLPWQADEEGLLYDANGQEIGYFVAIPDAATARILATVTEILVNHCESLNSDRYVIPREGDLVRLARPPAPIDRQAGGGRSEGSPLGHGGAALQGGAAGGPQDVARHPFARPAPPIPPRPMTLAEALAVLQAKKSWVGGLDRPAQAVLDCANRTVELAAERMMAAGRRGPLIPALEVTGP